MADEVINEDIKVQNPMLLSPIKRESLRRDKKF